MLSLSKHDDAVLCGAVRNSAASPFDEAQGDNVIVVMLTLDCHAEHLIVMLSFLIVMLSLSKHDDAVLCGAARNSAASPFDEAQGDNVGMTLRTAGQCDKVSRVALRFHCHAELPLL